MKKLILLINITLFSASKLYAQLTVEGKVIDDYQVALPFANVLLLKTSDSSLVKGSLTDNTGKFRIEYENNSPVFIKIEFIGFSSFNSSVLKTSENNNLGTITLKPETETLSEVEITAKRPLFEQKIDRMIVNVQNSVTSAGNTALNVLGKAPSVNVDKARNSITLLGNQGVIVMLNNKQIRMDEASLISLLESMPADNIKNIELITTPPASYDVQGNAGIININTIKQEDEGLSGRLTLNSGYGNKGKFGGNINLTYNKNKIYAYANISSNNNYYKEHVSINTDFNYGNESVSSDIAMQREPYIGLHSGELGFEYDISEKTKLGVSFNAQYRDWRMDAFSNTNIFNQNNDNNNQSVNSYEINKLLRTLTTLNFKHQWAENNLLSLDYDFISFDRDNPTEYFGTTTINDELTTNNFKSNGETPLSIHVFKGDFIQPITNNAKIETGLKTTFSSFKNDVSVSFLEDETFIDDPRFTDKYDMSENIYAAYVSFDWQVHSKLNLKSGLRYEYYNLDLSSISEGNILDRNTGNLFPTIYLNYKLTDNHEINLSYAKRIDRPGFLILAPAFYFFDQNTLFTGNPNIVPTKSTQYKLDFRYKKLNTSIQYTYNKLPIFNWQPELNEELQLFSIVPQQAAKSHIVSFSASIPWKITNWWSSSYNINSSYIIQNPIIEGVELEQKTLRSNLNTTHNYNLGKSFQLELSASYMSPYIYAATDVKSRYSIDLGIQKKFVNGSSLSLNVTDVFDTGTQWHLITDIPQSGIYYNWFGNYEGSIFRLSYTMPIGNKKVASREKRVKGSEEELQRLN